MRKAKQAIIFLNLILATVLALWVVFTDLQLKNITTASYDLSNNAILFSIFEDSNDEINETQRQTTIDRLKNILEVNHILMIAENIDDPGLAVFDSNGIFIKEALVTGRYEDFQNPNSVLVKTDSYTSNHLDQNNQLKNMEGVKFNVTGSYDMSYKLFNSDKEYIYHFFDSPTLAGYFYIDHADTLFLNNVYNNEIAPLMQRNHFTIHLERRYTQTFLSIISTLFSNSIYAFSTLMVILMYINLLLYYIGNMFRLRKVVQIHSMLGANRVKLTKLFLTNYLPSIFVSTIVGCILYIFAFRDGELMLSSSLFCVSAFSNIIISSILLILSVYYGSKIYLRRGGYDFTNKTST